MELCAMCMEVQLFSNDELGSDHVAALSECSECESEPFELVGQVKTDSDGSDWDVI